jgi:cyclic pyranopterin phosphate synthase
MSQPLVDQFQRRISYLRLSVIDRCDLRCTYCMPERQTFLPKSEVLSLEELHKLALGFIGRGVTKIRLTGEPLVRRDMIELVRAIGRKIGDGLEELTITTNGTRLAEFADDLREAGICRVNVSLDTLDRENLPGSPGAINCRRCLKASRRRARRACRSSSTPSR